MLNLIAGVLIGLILMRECYKLGHKADTTRLMLHVIWTRRWLDKKEIIEGLKAKGYLHRPALLLCVARMFAKDEIEFDPKARKYRLKAHEWT